MQKLLITACAIAGLLAQPGLARDAISPTQAAVAVCFVPGQGCAPTIVAAITAAKSTVHVQAYGFTASSILQALAQAKQRGVEVEVILDKSNVGKRGRYSGAQYMSNAGVPVWIDNKVAIAHNKVILIDGQLVIGGSYNYTNSAEQRNAENVTFITSPAVAQQFEQNWQSRKAASMSYDAAPLGTAEK